ncbi:hypothetical protein ABZZ20_05210 [Streptomyces sp. NPDC006430]|uniref:hypothetical protein n=1 Tax=Streptomyces sp. NPDC006430 TaxID=3154299 RepID=UPI0033ABCF4C
MRASSVERACPDAAGRSFPLRFLLIFLRLFPEARAPASGSGRAATTGRFMTGT